MIAYRYLLLFLFSFFMAGCFTTTTTTTTTTYVDKYDLTGKRVVTDVDTLPIGKVGEPYKVTINIKTPANLSPILGGFYDNNGVLLRKRKLEKDYSIKANREQRNREHLYKTDIFTNPQGLEFQLVQRFICSECDYEGYSNQLIISGIPSKAGIYDFNLQVLLNHPYFVNVFYRLEILP